MSAMVEVYDVANRFSPFSIFRTVASVSIWLFLRLSAIHDETVESISLSRRLSFPSGVPEEMALRSLSISLLSDSVSSTSFRLIILINRFFIMMLLVLARHSIPVR